MARVSVLLPLLLCASPMIQAQQNSTLPSKPKPVAQPAATPQAEPGASASSSEKLPVRRVVLYKNGVGYFEHLGRVAGSPDVHIDFTSAQLNDVLKSLTVLDLSGGRITGVDYNSEAPLARRLASLRLALGEKPHNPNFSVRCAVRALRFAVALALPSSANFSASSAKPVPALTLLSRPTKSL
jgi:hypothetical protein